MPKDPDLKKAQNARDRARKYGAKGAFTPQQWRLAVSVYGGPRCLCCQATDRPLTVDHVIPLSRGGNNKISNIQMLCWECNTRKGARVFDYRPLDKILTLRRVLKHCAAQAADARAARLVKIESLYAWCWLASRAYTMKGDVMTSTNTDQTTAAGSTVPRYDTPITTLEQMAAALDNAGVSYDDDSLAACFETFGNHRGYMLQIHAGWDAMAQFKAMFTMGALVLGWADSGPLVEYVAQQMAAAGLEFGSDLSEVELMGRAWAYMADGMGPIDAYWQAVEDWEDENLLADEEKTAIRATMRERSAEARERYRAAERAHRVEWVKAHEAAGQAEGSAADE
jgi:5-methylcytosine-specific restriction endonuclease McrA